MLTRLLAVAIATATLLLTGCQTMTTQGYLPPDKRDQKPFECPKVPDAPIAMCRLIRASRSGCEYIRVNRGGVFRLWLPEGWEYVEPGIAFKPPAAASAIDCPDRHTHSPVQANGHAQRTSSTGNDPCEGKDRPTTHSSGHR